jgi:hypothetical protein
MICLTSLLYPIFRPQNAPVGDLHWIWKGYASYKDIDLVSFFFLTLFFYTDCKKVQGVVAYARGNAFASALGKWFGL